MIRRRFIRNRVAAWLVHRHLPVVLTVLIGVGFSMGVFSGIRWWEASDIQKAFQLAAEDRAMAIKSAFHTELAMLELVRSSLISDGRIDEQEFREIVSPFLARRESIESVQWVPRVLERRRSEFEAASRREGLSGFQISERDNYGQIVPARKRSEYFPILFSGPRAIDKMLVGFDIASEPNRLQPLLLARDTGKIVASGRVAFIEDREGRGGFLVYLPAYEKDKPVETVAQRRDALAGCVLGVFRPESMLQAVLARLQPKGIHVGLYDPSDASGHPFYFHASRTEQSSNQSEALRRLSSATAMRYTVPLQVAGHPWTVTCVPTPEFTASRRTWWPWSMLAAGMGFTALSAGYLSRSIDRRHYIETLLHEKRRHASLLEAKVQEQTADIRRAQEEVIYRLVSASQWRDEETGTHIRRTGLLSEVLAKAAGWSESEAEILRQAAPMHDVGKIGIPDAILQKPGRLTPEEFKIMKTHTTIGAEMLANSNVPILQMARQIALNHHERWDGHGYPSRLAGHAIPECARILSIVDVYDALTHDRIYRPALPEEEVLERMRCGAGSHFDPILLALFFMNLEEIHRIAEEHPDEPGRHGQPEHDASAPLRA